MKEEKKNKPNQINRNNKNICSSKKFKSIY